MNLVFFTPDSPAALLGKSVERSSVVVAPGSPPLLLMECKSVQWVSPMAVRLVLERPPTAATAFQIPSSWVLFVVESESDSPFGFRPESPPTEPLSDQAG